MLNQVPGILELHNVIAVTMVTGLFFLSLLKFTEGLSVHYNEDNGYQRVLIFFCTYIIVLVATL